MDAGFTYRNLYLAKADATIANAILDTTNPQRRESFFAARRGSPEFFVVQKLKEPPCWSEDTYLIGIWPEYFIGYGDNTSIIANSIDPNYVIYAYSDEGRQFKGNTVIHEKSIPDKLRQRRSQNCNVKVERSTVAVAKSGDGVFFPMLWLFAIRLSAIHGKHYTIEMAAEEVYDLGMCERPEMLSTLDMPSDTWVPTPPQNTGMLTVKYAFPEATCLNVFGTKGNVSGMWIFDDTCSKVQPLAFYKCCATHGITSFPATETSHVNLDNLDRIRSKETVFITEYSRLCLEHHDAPFTLVGIFGEAFLPKLDFRPLKGMTCKFLEIRADGENSLERAHRVALKTFAAAYKKGVGDFSLINWDTGQETPMETLKREAMECGYLEDNADDESGKAQRLGQYLNQWQKPADQGKPIVGRLIKSGRCALLYADPGVGKSLFSQSVATVAYQRKSLDNGCFQYTWTGNKPCRILYIQNEMDAEEFEVRQKSLDGFLHVSGTEIEFHTPEESLSDIDEQIAVLKRLETLDPEGRYQWIVCIDSIKTVMPDVEVGRTFMKKVSPFIRVLKNAGCSILILHHSNVLGKISGGTNVNVTNNYKIHLVEQAAPNGAKRLQVAVDKGRDLVGNESASATWTWSVDETKTITHFESVFNNDEHEENTKSQAQSIPNAETSEAQIASKSLPKTWKELKALEERPEKQKEALFELWNMLPSIDALAKRLGASPSSIEKLKMKLGVNKKAMLEYFKCKNT